MQPDEKIVLEIFNDTGKIVSSEGTDVTITIPDAHLWSAEDPYLYTCKATLLQNGTAIDTARTSFGIRTLSWGKDGFLVNNKSVLFRGACIHHDNGVLGACGFHDAECRRVRILKKPDLMPSVLHTIPFQRQCWMHAINLVCTLLTKLLICG